MKKYYFCFLAIWFTIKSNTIVSQSQCATPSPLVIGANDNVCNSQSFTSLGPDFDDNVPTAITTVTNTCRVFATHNANWYSFTGDGTTIRVKIFGQNRASRFVVFENQSCMATMVAFKCDSFPDDDLPHTIDINTVNGSGYKIAVVGTGSSSMVGNICAYKTNGAPYLKACDPLVNTQAVNITVQANSSDCFTNFTNVVSSQTQPSNSFNRPPVKTGCDTSLRYWWGKFTAIGTTTKFFLWGKDDNNARFSVTNSPCHDTMLNIFCAPSTYSKGRPNYYEITTVIGQEYYVFIKNIMDASRLCIYSESSSQPDEPFCSGSMSFEDGTTIGWNGTYGSYHLVSAPGSVFKWDNPLVGMPTGRFELTSGTGVDPFVGNMLPIVAPGGGSYSFRIGNNSGNADTQLPADGYAGAAPNVHASVESMSYCFVVTSANAGFGYKYAVVSDYVAHAPILSSLFEVLLTLQSTGDTIPCSWQQNFPNDGHSAFKFVGDNGDIASNTGITFIPWTDVMVDLSAYIGQTICATYRVRDCEGGNNVAGPPYQFDLGGGTHWVYAYFDTYCSPINTSVTQACIGMPTTELCAPSGFQTYSWPAGQAGISGSPSTKCVTINNPVSGTYTVNVTSQGGCSATTKVVLTCNGTVSVEENTFEKAIIFPNPFNNTTTIQFKNVGIYNFTLIDQLGRVVRKEENISDSEIQINRNSLSDGIYFYNILDNNKQVIDRGKLIIEK